MAWFKKTSKKENNCSSPDLVDAANKLDSMDVKIAEMDRKLDELLGKEKCTLCELCDEENCPKKKEKIS